jgi:hypothetical protein
VKASEKFVRLIVRRPHAYEFMLKFKSKEVPIPGVVILDRDGKHLGASSLESAKELSDKLNELAKSTK